MTLEVQDVSSAGSEIVVGTSAEESASLETVAILRTEAPASSLAAALLRDTYQIVSLSRHLLKGTSLNDFNRKTLEDITCLAADLWQKFENAAPGASDLQRMSELRKWFLFTITNQNFCSPAHARENGVYQGGVVEISDKVKYLRSEINTPMLGEAYDRNVVLIRESAAESFSSLASKYIAFSSGNGCVPAPGISGLPEFLATQVRSGRMTVVTANNEEVQTLLESLAAFLDRPESLEFNGAIYIRMEGVLPPDVQVRLQDLLRTSGTEMQVLVEEAFDPFKAGHSGMRRVSFFHNQIDQYRYQLLQDAASMGFRPSLDDIVRYHFEAGKLLEILNTSTKTDDSIFLNHNDEPVEQCNLGERNGDYAALLSVVNAGGNILSGVTPLSPLEESILGRTVNEFASVEKGLQSVLDDPTCSVEDVARTFHESYYRARTLIQYAAGLAGPVLSDLERTIGLWEGGHALCTNSGMSAARVVITTLGEAIDRVYSTPHYWEIDFLVQNLFSRNPHYKEIAPGMPDRLVSVSQDTSADEIDRIAETIVAGNIKCPGGQMICADQSISPFFYTRTFNLKRLAECLEKHAPELKNPLYLVVDNTLDFNTINVDSLFPRGVPENVFLIFTASQAKLHQLGFDLTTAGIIQIHGNTKQSEEASRLRETFGQRLDAEGSRQSSYGAGLINQTFYSHYSNNTMAAYVDFMISKRHRNTRALIARIAAGLGNLAESPAEGIYKARDPHSGLPQILVKDRDGREHALELSFHFDPESCIHAYLKLLEPPTDQFVAGAVFEEIKRRVFKLAAARGIHLADGTSWGFTISRMDWYMHTMRLAVGLEHARNLAALGTIFTSVLKELLFYPDEFLKAVEVAPMTTDFMREHEEEILALDGLIPQAGNPDLECYLEDHPGREDCSFVVESEGEIASLLLAYKTEENGEKVIYISKAATLPSHQGKSYFRRMLEHLKDRAQEEGIERIVLRTSASRKNERVVKAYEKCGFSVKGVHGRIIAPEGWPLLLVDMELPVPGEAGTVAHFEPLPDELYSTIRDRGTLDPLREFLQKRAIELT